MGWVGLGWQEGRGGSPGEGSTWQGLGWGKGARAGGWQWQSPHAQAQAVPPRATPRPNCTATPRAEGKASAPAGHDLLTPPACLRPTHPPHPDPPPDVQVAGWLRGWALEAGGERRADVVLAALR